MYFNQAQKRFFQSASLPEKQAWLRKGEPEALEMARGSNFEHSFFVPLLRGLRLDGEFKTYPEAVAEAQRYLDELKAMPDLPELDEEALGITTFNQDLSRTMSEEKSYGIERVIHIAAQAEHICDDFAEFIDDELPEDRVREMLAEKAGNAGFLVGLHAIEDDAYPDHKPDYEEVFSLLYENGLMGWLVQAATPVCRGGAGGGVIYSWGCYYTQWFYSESYKAALGQVDAWAERMREQDLQEGEK